MIPLLVVAAVVALLVVRRRLKRRAARADGMVVSREDRTAAFARTPGRFRSRGGL